MAEGERNRDNLNTREAIAQQLKRAEDIGPLIKAIIDGSYAPKIPDSILENHNIVNEVGGAKPFFIWHLLKPERNAHAAFFIGEIWKKSGPDRDAFLEEVGSWEDVGQRNAEQEVRFVAIRTEQILDNNSEQWDADRDLRLKQPEDQWDYLDKAYSRFKKLVAFGHNNDILSNPSPSAFIERGILTARKTTWGLARLVPELCRRENVSMTGEEMKRCFNHGSTYQIIRILSGMNIGITVKLLSAMSKFNNTLDIDFVFKDEFFDLAKDSNGRYKVTMNHDRLLEIKDPESKAILIRQEPSSDTTGCPALYRIDGEKDVVKQYYDWISALAFHTYFKHIGSDSEK